jgi:hypothetical protein
LNLSENTQKAAKPKKWDLQLLEETLRNSSLILVTRINGQFRKLEKIDRYGHFIGKKLIIIHKS